MVKHLYVVLWRVSPPLKFICVVERSHERDEFAWDDPVKIAIFDFLVILIFFVVELLEIVPTNFDCVLETFQTVVDRAGI